MVQKFISYTKFLSDHTMKIDRMIQMLFNLMNRPTLIIILYCIFCTCIFSFQIPNTVTTDGYIGVRLILSSEKCSRGSGFYVSQFRH